jgi:hypothetical protein
MPSHFTEPYLSTSEIAEILQASKGSLSTMTRFLLQMGMLERVALPGKRVDHFRIKSGAWPELVRHAVYELSALRKLAERGLELVDAKDSEMGKRLEEARDLFAFVEREYPFSSTTGRMSINQQREKNESWRSRKRH